MANLGLQEFINKTRPTSVWEGPNGQGPNGGITQSMLSKFLVCRERFRLQVVEGLKPADRWSHRMGYGDMWHVCEEALAKAPGDRAMFTNPKKPHEKYMWEARLIEYSRQQCNLYPLQQEEISKWYEVCKKQFPLYVEHWSKHPDVVKRTPLLQEHVFDIPYQLPSGRTVRLRGKWDSVDLINGGIWLCENKTKGDINQELIQRQLHFDLQTLFYLVALQHETWKSPPRKDSFQLVKQPIVGVRYNVVRRPLSGGKGTIVQHKPTKSNPAGESKEEYYSRLAQYIKDEPELYFMRWNAEVSQDDIERFKHECLNPVLEQLCDWWEWIGAGHTFNHEGGIHFRMPYGCYSPLLDGGETEYDYHFKDGSLIGLRKVDNLFPELK